MEAVVHRRKVTLRLQNNGQGFPAEVEERLLEVLGQVCRGTELHSGDWGYRMSGAAWGRIRVETEEGQGVTFFLTLLST